MQIDEWRLLLLLILMSIALRLIGLYGGKYVSKNTTTQVILQALPGSLLIALLVPDLISRGLAGWLALAATLTLMKLTNNMLVSMVGGILMTAACRFTGIAG